MSDFIISLVRCQQSKVSCSYQATQLLRNYSPMQYNMGPHRDNSMLTPVPRISNVFWQLNETNASNSENLHHTTLRQDEGAFSVSFILCKIVYPVIRCYSISFCSLIFLILSASKWKKQRQYARRVCTSISVKMTTVTLCPHYERKVFLGVSV